MVSINQVVETDLAQMIAEDYGYEVELEVDKFEEELIEAAEDREEDLKRGLRGNSPGDMSTMENFTFGCQRKANVTSQEAGGITQHIGAYEAIYQDKKIVFLDTPGHEAFTAMRARGAQVTDIAVIVIAADDGVMPQTVEAINHVKAAEVPIIVAINKIDKADANPERVKQQLTEYGLVAEEWGGEAIMVEVSALKKTGLDTLMEMILLVAEMAELKANPDKPARGTVIEAKLEKGRGSVATVLIQEGTLRVGDSVVCGTIYGKVRAMVNDKGKRIKKAGPSTPVEIIGLTAVPESGDDLQAVKDDRMARQVAEKRAEKRREIELKKTAKVSLDDLFDQIRKGDVKDLNIIIKADVQGSVEALRESLLKLSTDEVRVQIIHEGVGAVTESDVMLASASNALIIGFIIRPEQMSAKQPSLREWKSGSTGLYMKQLRMCKCPERNAGSRIAEAVQGQAEVRQLFKISVWVRLPAHM